MSDLAKLREDAVKAIRLYMNDKMWAEFGVVMTNFSKGQAETLMDAVDNAIAATKADPRSKTLTM